MGDESPGQVASLVFHELTKSRPERADPDSLVWEAVADAVLEHARRQGLRRRLPTQDEATVFRGTTEHAGVLLSSEPIALSLVRQLEEDAELAARLRTAALKALCAHVDVDFGAVEREIKASHNAKQKSKAKPKAAAAKKPRAK